MASDKSLMAVIRTARPAFRNDIDKVAFAVHASFVAAGYELIATGPSAFSADALSSSSTDEVGIEHWNELEDEYGFVYRNPEKGSKVLVKCLVMDATLNVDAVASGGSDPVHCEIKVGDYVEEAGGSNYNTQYKNLQTLAKTLDDDVLSKLSGSSTSNSSSTPISSERTERSVNEPGYGAGSLGFGEVGPPPRFPAGGHSDLYPGPGAGMYPAPRGGFGDGGMLIGPGDRRFGGIGQPGFPGFPGGLPGTHDPRFGPVRPPGVPPGARFDPYGPPGIPDFDPDFVRRPQWPGSRIHPDLEQPGPDDYI